MADMKKRLAEMKDAWSVGKDKAIGVPESIYKMQLQAAFIAESSNGNLMIKREHLILEGEQEGEVVYDQIMLQTEHGPRWVAKWMGQMGFEAPDDVSEVEETVKEIEEAAPIYMGKVVIKDDFSNVRIQEVLETESERPERLEKPESKSTTPPDDGGSEELAVGDTVSYEEEGDMVTGTIEAFDPDDEDYAHVIGPDGKVWSYAKSDLTKVEPEEEEADEELTALLALAQATDIEVSDSDDKETVVKKLDEYTWDADQLTADEVTLLEAVNIKIQKPKRKPVKKVTKAKPKKSVRRKK